MITCNLKIHVQTPFQNPNVAVLNYDAIRDFFKCFKYHVHTLLSVLVTDMKQNGCPVQHCLGHFCK